MSKKMKNIAQSEVLMLREQISYQEGQVVSKTLTQNQAVSITLFSFAKGEEISTHESGGDAFVTCLDGIGKIRAKRSAPMNRVGTPSSPAWMVSEKSRLMALNICCTKENLLSCQQAIHMRYMGRKRSRCF